MHNAGARMRGFDRAFLRALASASNANKLVLGETLRGDRPSPGQRVAVGQQKNIRALNVPPPPPPAPQLGTPLAFSCNTCTPLLLPANVVHCVPFQ